MQTRQLGNTDLNITRIGFGAWAIGGGGWEYGWGPQDDTDSINAIQHALDSGINWIDTAAVYGLGHSEEIVAQALKGRANKPYVFTKCALVWDENRNIRGSMKQIRREVEDSLRRLQTDVIDLYQIHWPNPDVEIEEGWRTMADLKAEGKVRYIGVSNFDVDQMKRAQSIASISSLQPPYSLVKPEVQDEILPFCKEHNIGVIVYSPMYSGLLSGTMTRERIQKMAEDDWRKRDEEFTEPRLTRNLELAEKVKSIAVQHNRSAAEIAIAWTLLNPAVTAAIVGARNPQQIDGFIGAADVQLSSEDLKELEAF